MCQKEVLYEVLSNPRARHGQDLLDIGGKVEFISIARAEDNMPEVARIDDPQQVEGVPKYGYYPLTRCMKDLFYPLWLKTGQSSSLFGQCERSIYDTHVLAKHGRSARK